MTPTPQNTTSKTLPNCTNCGRPFFGDKLCPECELPMLREQSETFRQTIRDREANELEALALVDQLRAELATVNAKLANELDEVELKQLCIKGMRVEADKLATRNAALEEVAKAAKRVHDTVSAFNCEGKGKLFDALTALDKLPK